MFNLIPNAGKSLEQRKAENDAREKACAEWKANEGKELLNAAPLTEEEKALMEKGFDGAEDWELR